MDAQNHKVQIIYTERYSMNWAAAGITHVCFHEVCTMEMRLDTVEAVAEHGVILQGSSEWFVQGNEINIVVRTLSSMYLYR